MGWLQRFLNARPRREMDGLRLLDPQWQVAGVTDPERFFSALLRLVSPDALLFLEGGAHPPRLRTFLEAQNVTVKHRPALGTMWPAAPYFCVRARPEVVEELVALVSSLAYPEVCEHLHVLMGDRVLVSGYDAFSDPFYVSGNVPEQKLQDFCATAGCSYKHA
jgi:hypothetical protein